MNISKIKFFILLILCLCAKNLHAAEAADDATHSLTVRCLGSSGGLYGEFTMNPDEFCFDNIRRRIIAYQNEQKPDEDFIYTGKMIVRGTRLLHDCLPSSYTGLIQEILSMGRENLITISIIPELQTPLILKEPTTGQLILLRYGRYDSPAERFAHFSHQLGRKLNGLKFHYSPDFLPLIMDGHAFLVNILRSPTGEILGYEEPDSAEPEGKKFIPISSFDISKGIPTATHSVVVPDGLWDFSSTENPTYVEAIYDALPLAEGTSPRS